ncbi:hypothetical protein WMF31_38705 [Sorangium sp. So ce1036]|uniref:hypothetical protein n=1 Tax=Sorangium sp. So ce1036 TaxID=3133328 RepID=UPI003F09DC11
MSMNTSTIESLTASVASTGTMVPARSAALMPERVPRDMPQATACPIPVLVIQGDAAADRDGVADPEVAAICRFIHANGGAPFLALRSGTLLPPVMYKQIARNAELAVIAVRHRETYLPVTELVRALRGTVVSAGATLGETTEQDLVFHGAMVFPSHVQRAVLVLASARPALRWIELIDELSRRFRIGTMPIAGGQQGLGGGSFARSRVVSTFRKTASGHGRQKLLDEIGFLKRVPEPLRALYPQVLRDGEDEAGVFMEQEFINWPTVRAHLLYRSTDPAEIVNRLRGLLHTLNEHSYQRDTERAPDDYLDKMHFGRVWKRLELTRELSPIFAPIIEAQEIVVNGRAHKNIPQLLREMEESSSLRSFALPAQVGPFVHGDLHFENILFDPETTRAKLVDPRGYPLCDIYYDLGKISHSTNGRYDFLHEGQFSLDWHQEGSRVSARLDFPKTPQIRTYDAINRHLHVWCHELTGDDMAAGRMLFNEAMHFCADMPFHIVGDGREARALAIYFMGVELINDFMMYWGHGLERGRLLS